MTCLSNSCSTCFCSKEEAPEAWQLAAGRITGTLAVPRSQARSREAEPAQRRIAHCSKGAALGGRRGAHLALVECAAARRLALQHPLDLDPEVLRDLLVVVAARRAERALMRCGAATTAAARATGERAPQRRTCTACPVAHAQAGAGPYCVPVARGGVG